MNALKRYGSSGDLAQLMEVGRFFTSHMDKLHNVDHRAALSAIPHLVSAIERKREIECRAAWYVLYFLTEKEFNSGAPKLLSELQTLPPFKRLLRISLEHLRTSIDREYKLSVIKVLATFMAGYNDGRRTHRSDLKHMLFGDCTLTAEERDIAARRRMVCDTLGMVEEIIHLVATETASLGEDLVDAHYVMFALSGVAEARVERTTLEAEGRDRCVETFLRAGGMDALVQVLYLAVENNSRLTARDRDANCYLEFAASAMDTLFLYFMEEKAPGAELLALDRNAIFRMKLILYAFFSLPHQSQWARCSAVPTFSHYFTWLDRSNNPDVLQESLLYRPPRKFNVPPLAVLLRDSLHCLPSADLEAWLTGQLGEYREKFPAVADALAQHPVQVTLPDRPHKDRHCAYPGCPITGEGLAAAMLKCARCRAVYYCGTTHQQKHWPEHKKTCDICS